jgi:hypothetical protein
MGVQRLGVTYQLGIDFQTIDTAAYGLIVIGRTDLAKEFLLATGQPEEQINAAIAATIETIKQANADQTAVPAPVEDKVELEPSDAQEAPAE